MILLFTCAHCFAYQEVEEDVYDLQSGFCFECKHCHKDTVVLLATEKDYHVAADAIAIRLTRLGADAEQQQTLSEPETPRRSSQDG